MNVTPHDKPVLNQKQYHCSHFSSVGNAFVLILKVQIAIFQYNSVIGTHSEEGNIIYIKIKFTTIYTWLFGKKVSSVNKVFLLSYPFFVLTLDFIWAMAY